MIPTSDFMKFTAVSPIWAFLLLAEGCYCFFVTLLTREQDSSQFGIYQGNKWFKGCRLISKNLKCK